MTDFNKFPASEPEDGGLTEQDYCVDCGKHYDKCKCTSPCCGAEIIHSDICSECLEHCI